MIDTAPPTARNWLNGGTSLRKYSAATMMMKIIRIVRLRIWFFLRCWVAWVGCWCCGSEVGELCLEVFHHLFEVAYFFCDFFDVSTYRGEAEASCFCSDGGGCGACSCDDSCSVS